jgi:hypothetical protein
MSQKDDFLLRGALRRVQIVDVMRADVPEIGQGDDTEAVPDDVPEDVQESTPQQARGEATQARGGFTINVDEEAKDWIKVVRDGGGGLTIGPEDGIIAVPEGASERDEQEPVKEDVEKPEPETIDDIRKMGRDALDGKEEDTEEEVEGAINRTMMAIRRLMVGVEKSLFERRKHG